MPKPALHSLLLSVLLTTPLCAADTATLKVAVSGLQHRPGELYVLLYREGEHWLDSRQAYRLQRLPAGEYGLYAFHDKNGNGQFNMRWLPWPKPAEGAAVSNNAVRNGPPRYDDARFTLLPGVTGLALNMKYH